MKGLRLSWRCTALTALSIMVAATTGCGAQLSKEQKESGQVGMPRTSGYAADRKLSEELNGYKKMPGASSSGSSTAQSQSNGNTIKLQSAAPASGDMSIPIVSIGGKDYIVAADLAKALGFNTDWNAQDQTFQMGDNDAEYLLKPGSTTATKEEDQISLSDPPILHNSQLHIPVSALNLFSEDVNTEAQGKTLVLHASDLAVDAAMDGPEEANTGAEDDFEDDPADPLKGESDTEPSAAPTASSINEDEPAVPVIKNININGVIQNAKRYMGVKYKFGAKPYPVSGRFDCSTFTQYNFAKFGVKLPRVARAQSKVGTTVSKKQLRKGDLLFFYVPGRFRTNKVVGHVGIYMGNQKMIHSSPEPKNGVQISMINKPYWKKTFLKAERIAY
ncbi:C40 family peptidase [Paenibacillus cremeus]|uniref:Peptidoglycan endopeptidase n=1 Tax=Paenibacillus cremeus TaxID=2163881 RepID=A0A559K5N5_9BACL|nr:C40 family peptidase [Paenibacillus cremeus]TVY07458.1 peptidoglycan endopeptidase [Paenibacillus cremeus]